MVLRVTERERATILAALRRWLSYPAAREADLTATNRGKLKPLDDGEIQRLCQRLSETAKRGNAPPFKQWCRCAQTSKTAGVINLMGHILTALDHQLNAPSIRASALQHRSRPTHG